MKKKMSEIEKKDDEYSRRSAEILKELLDKKIKRVYVGALRIVEMRFGTDFDGYDEIRREILRIGNDSVRDLSTAIDTEFNVEQVPEVFTVFTTKGSGVGKENTNGHKDV